MVSGAGESFWEGVDDGLAEGVGVGSGGGFGCGGEGEVDGWRVVGEGNVCCF